MRKFKPGVFASVSAAVLLTGGLAAHAAPVYNATGENVFYFDFGSTDLNAVPTLDDVTLSPSVGATAIRSMTFGYQNVTATPVDTDAIVTFWDTVNTAATGSQVVNSTQLGSFTVPLGLIAGDETAVLEQFDLPDAINVADGNLGVSIEFVQAGTNTRADVVALLTADAPTVGSTDPNVWVDNFPNDNSFTGDELVSDPNGSHLYLLLDSSPVPEPTGLAALGLVALTATARRRRRH